MLPNAQTKAIVMQKKIRLESKDKEINQERLFEVTVNGLGARYLKVL